MSFRYLVVYGGTLRAKRVQEFCLLQASQTNPSVANFTQAVHSIAHLLM